MNNELINAQREVIQRNVRLERAEEALRKAHDDLERQVRERTRELENTLSAFREEVSVHQKTEEKLRELSLTVLRIQDEERRRVARDLHDTVGQTLTALKITLSMLGNAVARYPQTADFLAELNGLADQALQEIRTTSYLCILRFSTSRVLRRLLPGTSTGSISGVQCRFGSSCRWAFVFPARLKLFYSGLAGESDEHHRTRGFCGGRCAPGSRPKCNIFVSQGLWQRHFSRKACENERQRVGCRSRDRWYAGTA